MDGCGTSHAGHATEGREWKVGAVALLAVGVLIAALVVTGPLSVLTGQSLRIDFGYAIGAAALDAEPAAAFGGRADVDRTQFGYAVRYPLDAAARRS